MLVWLSQEFDAHEQVCFFNDELTGLRLIVAIHSTALGPAAGGTRFKTYCSDLEALDDALRLSRAMSYKSALAGLPIGGGKAVIIGDPAVVKSRALLHAFGCFIDRIGKSFATGEDVGMSVADMDVVHEVTPYVGGTSAGSGDPSVHTAVGMMYGLRAVAKAVFDSDDLVGMRVAVQGLGAVGWGVAERLQQAGVRLTVADVRPDQVARAVEMLGADAMSPHDILEADVDILCPCALGGVLDEQSVRRIRARAVAGAANNQLSNAKAGQILADRGIIFAPDYVMNAGGIISGLEATRGMPHRQASEYPLLEESLAAIYDRVIEILGRAEAASCPPEAMAEQMARERIGRPAHGDKP